jgi:hypothetical protein
MKVEVTHVSYLDKADPGEVWTPTFFVRIFIDDVHRDWKCSSPILDEPQGQRLAIERTVKDVISRILADLL